MENEGSCIDEGSSQEESHYQLDDMGFLVSPEQWAPGFVERFAGEEGIGLLTGSHWSLIKYARSFFLTNGRSPMPPEYARQIGQSIRRIQELFPKGLLSIHRLAGLPQPKSC